MIATASYEILRVDCGGKAVFMEGTAFEVKGEISIAADVLELLHSMINTRASAACSDWSEDEYSTHPSAKVLAQPHRSHSKSFEMHTLTMHAVACSVLLL